MWQEILFQADNNLDSTRVGIPVTYTSLCSLVTSFSSNPGEAADLCRELTDIQASVRREQPDDLMHELDDWAEPVTRDIGQGFTADQAATLIRLVQALKPNYDPLANNTVDPRGTAPSNAAIAFGGAGNDILIANTASHRLIDASGDANTYIYPCDGDARPSVITESDPEVVHFLYELSLALGADPTR